MPKTKTRKWKKKAKNKRDPMSAAYKRKIKKKVSKKPANRLTAHQKVVRAINYHTGLKLSPAEVQDFLMDDAIKKVSDSDCEEQGRCGECFLKTCGCR